jgi:hypothetical protein
MYNLHVVPFDPHLHRTGFSTATGLTRTVADSLNYLSSRSPTIHPSLYVIENKPKGLRLVGHNAQKTSFSGNVYPQLHFVQHIYLPFTAGSIIVKQIGHAVLTVSLPSGTKEEYLITLPRLRIDGLWYGSPYIELAETSYIIGGGHVSLIEYKGKGYFSGKSHSFKATVTPMPGMGGQGKRETVIEGTWHEKSQFVKGGSGDFHDVHAVKEEVSPIGGGKDGEVGDFETRKLLALVAKGIREGDFETASKEQSRIEACSVSACFVT